MNPRLGTVAAMLIIVAFSAVVGPYAGVTSGDHTPTQTETTAGAPTATETATQTATETATLTHTPTETERTETTAVRTATAHGPAEQARRATTPTPTPGNERYRGPYVFYNSCRNVTVTTHDAGVDRIVIGTFDPTADTEMDGHGQRVIEDPDGRETVTVDGATVISSVALLRGTFNDRVAYVEGPCPRPTPFLGSTHTPYCYTDTSQATPVETCN